MPSKTVEIDFNKIGQQIKDYSDKAQVWLNNFIKTMDDYEKLAVLGIGIGFVLVIAGIIIM